MVDPSLSEERVGCSEIGIRCITGLGIKQGSNAVGLFVMVAPDGTPLQIGPWNSVGFQDK